MSVGKFKLQYQHMDAIYPCEGVSYRLVNKETGQYFSYGITNASGETKPVESVDRASACRLEILDHQVARYDAPDIHDTYGISVYPELELGAAGDASSTLETVRIKPYFRVRFQTHAGSKPIAGAKFKAYLTDAQGREAIARELDRSLPITGTTNSEGETGVIFCAAPLKFKFEIPGSTVHVSSGFLQPLIKGQKTTRHDVVLKTAIGTTVPKKQDLLQTLTGLVSMPVLISPEDDELIAVPQSAFDEFEQLSGQLEQIMANGHRAKLDLSRALESGQAKDIQAAEKALGLAEDKIKNELNKNFSKQADLKEVVTVESFKKGKDAATGTQQMGLRRRYLSKDKYQKLKAERINKNEFKLKIKFAQGPANASASVSPKNLDVQALKDSFSKIKTEIKSKHELGKTDPKVWSLLDEAATQYSDTVVKSDTYEVEQHAQWLRFVAGAGASSEIDWKSKTAVIQGNLQAKLVLCEGKRVMRYAYPSLKGWMMRFSGEDLGAIRAVVSCEVYGFAGAKLVGSGAVGVSLQGLKQVVVGLPKDQKAGAQKLSAQVDAKRKLPVFDPMSAHEEMPDDLNGIKADIDAFAGVEGGITPGGQLQWLPPTAKDFVSFAEVSATLGGTAGIGGNAKLFVYLAKGKFRVKVSAGLCLGVGAKGSLEFTVNAEKLFEFIKWVHYQLLNAGVKKLVYFEQRAFMALSQLLLLLVQKGIELSLSATADQAQQAALYRSIERMTSAIDKSFAEWIEQIEMAEVREQLVQNINRTPQWLVHATPETRGMLLYQITRHGLPSHSRNLPSVSMGWDPKIHFLPDHKKAVINIMATVQTAREWENVMQHMSADGELSERSAGNNEGDVIRFLDNGYLLAEDLPSLISEVNRLQEVKNTGNPFLDQYLAMRHKVRKDFPKGYKVVRLDTPHLDIALPDGREHPGFGMIQTAEIGLAYAGDVGSNVA